MSSGVARATPRCLRLACVLAISCGCARPPPPSVVVPPAPGSNAARAPEDEVQRVVDDVLAASTAPAAAVVLDVEGSRVLALGRRLGADPATQARRPGSTVKPLIAWVAAEQGVLAPREVITCDRAFSGSEGFHCFDRHGPLDAPSAIAVSCNVYFMELGVRLGLARVAGGLTSFGLARRTGLVPGEVDGFIATPEWLASTPGLSTMRREAVVAAGHGPLEVTLLELAVAYARLATRLSSPHPRVPDTIRGEILDGLRRVVNDPSGTGRAAAVLGLDIAGKTGTAEGTSFAEQQRGAPEPAENGWFVGFTPSERPRRVVAVVVLGQGGAAKTAAPLAGRLFERLR
jgi:cell division protein FtsI/penicillin-binding protein 2